MRSWPTRPATEPETRAEGEGQPRAERDRSHPQMEQRLDREAEALHQLSEASYAESAKVLSADRTTANFLTRSASMERRTSRSAT